MSLKGFIMFFSKAGSPAQRVLSGGDVSEERQTDPGIILTSEKQVVLVENDTEKVRTFFHLLKTN